MTRKKFGEVAFMFNELDAVEENIDTIRDIMLSAPAEAPAQDDKTCCMD